MAEDPAPKKKKKRRGTLKRLSNSAPVRWIADLGVEWVAFWVVLCGPRVSYFAARILGALLWIFARRLRGVALRNVDLCLPELSLAERTRIARASFRHAVYLFIDILLMPSRFRNGGWKKYVRLEEGSERHFQWLKEDLPSFNMAAHHGSWEINGFIASMEGKPLNPVMREIRPPAMNRRVKRVREMYGGEVIEKQGALRGLVKLARRNKAVALLVDQNGGDFAPILPFFGVPARWQADFAPLVRRMGGRMAFGLCAREGERFRFLNLATRIYQFGPDADPDEILRAYRDELERMIRAYPDQYFWMHRRFKGRPKGSPDRYANLGQRLDAEARRRMIGEEAQKPDDAAPLVEAAPNTSANAKHGDATEHS